MTPDERALAALSFAVQGAPDVITPDDARDVVEVAERFYRFLERFSAAAGTARLVVTAKVDGAPVTLKPNPGGSMTQIVNATVDNTTVTLTIASEDDHGNPTSDALTITNDDTANAVADWVQSPGSYVGTLKQVEGTVNISITDPSVPSLAATDVQLVVGAGATSQVQVTATVV